ncbi:WGR domain-containing protein [Rubellimicrobium rubrum]|uniref:WGR domain-containing protein n=1 Tax=Rubellimicrobium rubrum TaxID=2585369 RepID=UPI003CCC8BC5
MQHAAVLQRGADRQPVWGARGHRNWGRIGASGQVRTDWYEDPSKAASALQGLLRAKRRRGYTA